MNALDQFKLNIQKLEDKKVMSNVLEAANKAMDALGNIFARFLSNVKAATEQKKAEPPVEKLPTVDACVNVKVRIRPIILPPIFPQQDGRK